MTKLLAGAAAALTAICLSGPAFALGSTPVTVVNPADIAKAEGIQTPFRAETNCIFGQIASGDCIAPITAPASQRLVIEFVTGQCTVIGNNVISGAFIGVPAGLTTIQYNLIPGAPLPNSGGTAGNVTISQLVRLYADQGIVFQILSGPSTNDGQSCHFAVSGQAITVP